MFMYGIQCVRCNREIIAPRKTELLDDKVMRDCPVWLKKKLTPAVVPKGRAATGRESAFASAFGAPDL